jgi:hypothetical protein
MNPVPCPLQAEKVVGELHMKEPGMHIPGIAVTDGIVDEVIELGLEVDDPDWDVVDVEVLVFEAEGGDDELEEDGLYVAVTVTT